MKKFYMTMAAMLFSFAAMAQGLGTLSCEDAIYAGDPEDPAYLEVTLTTDDVTAISGIQFNFALPEGVSIADDGEDYEFPIAAKKHNTGIMDATDGYMVYLGGDRSLNYKDPTKNAVVKIGLVADAGCDGNYTINFVKAVMSDKSDPVQSFEVPDFSAKLIVSGTGINSINAANSKAPVYNLAGQRVSKAQKGVYIQNGKKVAVK